MTSEEAIKVLTIMAIQFEEFTEQSMAIGRAIEALEKEKPKTCGMCTDFWRCELYVTKENPFAEQCMLFKEKR